jgi:hypothetical protein
MRSSSLFTASKPAGGDHEVVPYEQFVGSMRIMDRWSTIETLTRMGWAGWSRAHAAFGLNEVSRISGARLAAIALAKCGNTGRRESVHGIESLLWRSLAIANDFTLDAALTAPAERLATRADASTVSELLPDLETCRAASIHISLARMFRAQWANQISSVDEILRLWWMLKRADARVLSDMESVLAMPPAMFVRAAHVGLVVAIQNQGFIDARHGLSRGLQFSYEVDSDALKLCARSISLSHREIENWHELEVARHPEEFRQYVSLPFTAAPIFPYRWGEQDHHYICPSPDLYLNAIPAILERAAVTAFVRRGLQFESSLESHGAREIVPRLENNFLTDLGFALDDYVEALARSLLGRDAVHRISKWEIGTDEQADFFITDGKSGLIVEVKRIIATEMAKDLLSHHGVVAVLEKLFKAYSQISSSYRRKAWQKQRSLRNIDEVCGLIVVDEAVVAEGGLLALLLDHRAHVRPYFEVMSVTEFERLISTHSVTSIVRLLRQKWIQGHVDQPLRLFAREARHPNTLTLRRRPDFLGELAKEIHRGHLPTEPRSWP